MSADRSSGNYRRASGSEREDQDFERRSSGWVGVKDRLRTRSLYRDRQNGIICGICAGIALYFGVERFVVRLIVIAGLIFGLAGVIIPAYIILYFVLEDVSKAGRSRERESARGSSRSDSDSDQDTRYEDESLDESSDRSHVHDQPPRIALRSVRATMQSLELRMRRIERFVTSSNYELNKELHKL